tara:strand:+ start:504 stop:740 length:237 start_codon:yes stop_codon:yes gene_type:complete
MPKYYKTVNTGRGFITHEDNELSHISGYPGDIWVTDNTAWAIKKNLTELSKVEAQTVVNTAISGSNDEDGNQIVINLP